jgi:capsule synthesis protein PGA_cap
MRLAAAAVVVASCVGCVGSAAASPTASAATAPRRTALTRTAATRTAPTRTAATGTAPTRTAPNQARNGPFPSAVTLEWVGDMALSTERGLPPGSLQDALAPVNGYLHLSDVTLGNLEGTLSDTGASKCGSIGSANCFAFQAPPAYAGELHALGFGLVNMANNHSLDYGDAGRAETIGALDSGGVAQTGLPGEITYLNVRGTPVAFLGFAPYTFDSNLLDIPTAVDMVRRARAHAPVVVVIIHAGAEGAGELHTPYGEEYYLGEDRGNARAFAHSMIDAGASIVLGSGPHVIRGIERYRRHLIAYSLGNFVGYHTLGGGGVLSLSGILQVTLGTDGRVLTGRWFSMQLQDGLPYPDATNASAQLVAALSGQDFPSDHFNIAANGVFELPAPR